MSILTCPQNARYVERYPECNANAPKRQNAALNSELSSFAYFMQSQSRSSRQTN